MIGAWGMLCNVVFTACNRTVDAHHQMTGRLTSPNYPNPYDHNSSCTTTLTAAQGYYLFLVFKDFKLEKVRRSFHGRLSSPIREMQIIDSFGNRTERYCDYKLPPSFLSSGNSLQIYFKSDSTMAPGGYDVYYYAVQPSYVETSTLYDFGAISELQGAITNVGYPGYKNRQRMSSCVL
ncbi:unnamed protein product [Gongylonema pulchrum]|uniref:CUB domain-containing protein n=1 Tax=Gongylonema pulchrum TaxID=637853 RepID=A0A183EDI8_9BILA|nr:unnamed protein product [Gongylonema pulchrum]